MSGKSVKMPEMSLFSKKKTNNFLLDHMIELLLVVIIVLLAIMEPAFLKTENILNVLRNSAMKGVIAYGMCLVIISGEIDLSVGSQVALSAVIVAWVAKHLNDAGIMPLAAGAVVGLLAAHRLLPRLVCVPGYRPYCRYPGACHHFPADVLRVLVPDGKDGAGPQDLRRGRQR